MCFPNTMYCNYDKTITMIHLSHQIALNDCSASRLCRLAVEVHVQVNPSEPFEMTCMYVKLFLKI